jgi:beta-phosphoglucomutase-like phosphatase (HAD superfamily)
VTAALSAGMQVVMVPDCHVPDDQRTQATQVLKSLLDFNPQDFDLPAFKN